MRSLYLSGAVTNNPEYKETFKEAYQKLTKAGYTVYSPIHFCNEDWDWQRCMRRCIEVLIKLNGVAIVGSIENSKGSKLELEIAANLNMDIKTVDEWCMIKRLT